MEWKDGSIKNVHIDPVLLSDYQRHLKIALGVYHKRLEWLNSESQKSFGIIREEKYVAVCFFIPFSSNKVRTLARKEGKGSNRKQRSKIWLLGAYVLCTNLPFNWIRQNVNLNCYDLIRPGVLLLYPISPWKYQKISSFLIFWEL